MSTTFFNFFRNSFEIIKRPLLKRPYIGTFERKKYFKKTSKKYQFGCVFDEFREEFSPKKFENFFLDFKKNISMEQSKLNIQQKCITNSPQRKNTNTFKRENLKKNVRAPIKISNKSYAIFLI